MFMATFGLRLQGGPYRLVGGSDNDLLSIVPRVLGTNTAYDRCMTDRFGAL